MQTSSTFWVAEVSQAAIEEVGGAGCRQNQTDLIGSESGPRKKNKGCLKGHIFIDRAGDAPAMTQRPPDMEDVPGSCYSLPAQKKP